MTAAFPLSISPNGRYLIDANGDPFIVKGDSAWLLFNELDATGIDTYLSDRQSKGFNTAVVQCSNPVKYVASNVSPEAVGAGLALPFSLDISGNPWNGDPTFTLHNAAFSSPVTAYWDWVDYVIGRALHYGICLIMDSSYWGYQLGATDGWYQTINNAGNTAAVCFAFGQYLGNRWKHFPNIISSMGTDTFPTPASTAADRIAKMQDGLIAGGFKALTLGHFQRSSGSLDISAYVTYMTLRGTYSGTGNSNTYAPNYARLRQEWAASPTMPTFSVESNYEPDRSTDLLRALAYQAILSSPAGYAGYGQDQIWTFDTTWQSKLSTTGALDLQRLWTLVDSFPNWCDLQPRDLGTVGALVTAGGGTLQTMANATPTNNSNAVPDNTNGTDWVAAAATPDGKLLLAYFPSAHSGSCTIDMTKMQSGATVTQDWFDPTNGTYTSAGAVLPATGTHAFTIPGNNSAGATDWLLVLRINQQACSVRGQLSVH